MEHNGLLLPPFDRLWFARHPLQVAFDMLGSWIVVDRQGERVSARIVEVEAYGGMEDLASHATMYRVGRETVQNDAGILYLQFSYGLHTMTNIVSHAPGDLGAVLLRAAEDPVEGFNLARERRGSKATSLLVGPACLSQGVGTRLSDTLEPLGLASGIMILPGEPVVETRASPRIGISRATHALWRLFDGQSRFVSKHRHGEAIQKTDLTGIIDQLPIDR